MRDVSRMLAARIETLALELFPAGVREGAEFKIGSLAGEPGRSLSIALRGPKAGVWSDFSAGTAGDALELVAHALYQGSRRSALQWSMRGLSLSDISAPDHVCQARSGGDEPKVTNDSTEAARRLWTESRPAAGSIVETYLAARRLVLPDADCIRFHPSCPHGPGQRHPVMLALMTDAVSNQPTGIHRTPLLDDGRGRPAGVDKKMLGRAGVIRLAPDDEVTAGLGLAEGIETALSVIQHAEWRSVWAACTAGGIARFPVLNGISSLTIFADHDTAKVDGSQPGTNAARACALRWSAAGREARIIHPRRFGDWNDVAREAGQ
jgi:hypothetical protein